MLRKLLSLVLPAAMALTSFGANAQTANPNWCGTDAAREQYYATHPGAREAQRVFDQQITALAQAQPRGTSYVTDVTIPVVVHVIHGGGPENISDQQIYSAIDQLNLDFQKGNPDTAAIIPAFQPIAASIGFRFRLAKKDPNGNCTTGITRDYRPDLLNDNQSGAIQAVSNWDRARYMNIWVVGSIGVPTSIGVVKGYVSPPNTPTNPNDGFVVVYDSFGTIGQSTLRSTRAATHEIGHYFNLDHTWGAGNPGIAGNCSGTDNVADTPPTNGIQSCNLNYAPCGQVANVQNFMDYSFCFVMFTQGQRARMRALLAAARTMLVSSANLSATGTNDGYIAPNCAPIAAFSAISNTSVCINTPVTFRDFSTNYTATGGTLTYTWSFPGGTPATATGPTVSVSYPTAGFYSVTETVSNSVGPSSVTQTNIVKVEGPTGGETAPLQQSFEDPAFPALFAAPSLRNYELSGTTSAGVAAAYRWQRQTAFPAADGTAYLQVPNRIIPAGGITTLVTPNINLSAVSGTAALRFARSYALRSATDDCQLRVSFSSDCGVTWSTPTTFTAATLSNQGTTPIDGFVPTSAASWRELTVAIPAQFQGSGLFKARLQMVNGTSQGNTFFLDNLRISNPLGTKADALAQRGIAVYPNPLTRETAVHLTLTANTQIQVSLRDVLGRTVLSLPAKTYAVGQQAIALQPAAGQSLKAGVYVVHIALDGQTFTSKLNVE